MKINTWLLTLRGQVWMAMSLFIFLSLTIWSAPFFFTPIMLSLLPIVFYIMVYKTSLLTVLLFLLLFFRVQDLILALQPYRVVLGFTLLLGISFFINLVLKKIKLYWSSEMTYFLVFFSLVSIGVVLTHDFETSFKYWSEVFLKIGILFFIISWTLKDKNDFLWVTGIIVTGGFVLSIITLYNYMHGVGLVEGSRATLGIEKVPGDPNDLALNLLIPFSFAASLFYAVDAPKKIRILGLIVSFFIVCAIVATKSRGGLLGLSVILLYFFYPSIKSKFFLILLGFMLLGLLYMIAGISHREGGGGLDMSAMERVAAWMAAINMAIHHPIFGVGLNEFINNFYGYTTSEIRNNPLYRTDLVAHSIWFNALAESGFLGFIFFIICIYSAFKLNKLVIKKIKLFNYQKNRGDPIYLIFAYSLYGALIGYCVAGSFLNQAFTGIFYFLFALSVALSHVIEERTSMSIEKNDKNT